MSAAAPAAATDTEAADTAHTDTEATDTDTATRTDAGVDADSAAATSESQPDTDYRDFEYTPGGPDAERSSASQWLILVAQVLASAVAGAALFIGFQLLWRDLTWVAMALAIVVIVGLVAMVRVLRRSNDRVSIALAVVVGLGVTCGPLLLRAVT